MRVVVMGTGGLSHQLDGTRAGFINREFDMECIDRLEHDPEALTRYSVHDLVEKSGTQGVEVMAWIAARATMPGKVTKVHCNYHIPISNTASALLVLESQDIAAPRRSAAA